MKSFNLFSTVTRKKALAKTMIKLPTAWAALFGVLILFAVLGLFAFFINTYYSLQVNDKGNYLISLINEQSKYNDKITTLNNFDSRTAASASITTKRLNTKDFITKIDTLTNNTVKTYNIDTSTFTGNINGTINNMDDCVNIATQLKTDEIFKNVKLTEVSKLDQNKSEYSYTILFDINSEKI